MNRTALLAGILTAGLLMPAAASAQTFTHNFTETAPGTYSFGEGANWDTGSAPSSASHFIRFNNGEDSTAATVDWDPADGTSYGGFEINNQSANVTIAGSVNLAPSDSYSSTVAPGRTLTIGDVVSRPFDAGKLTGSPGAVLSNAGTIDVAFGTIESLAIRNTGTVLLKDSIVTSTIDNSGGTITASDRPGINSSSLDSTTVSGGTLNSSGASGFGSNAILHYKDATIVGSRLSGTGNHIIPSFHSATFDGITYDARGGLLVRGEATAIFKGSNQLFHSVANDLSYGNSTVVLDGATLTGIGSAHIINDGGSEFGNLITGHGTFNIDLILNRRSTVEATGGDLNYQGARLLGGTLSGDGAHVVGGAGNTSKFEDVTLAAGATLRSADGAGMELSGATTIDGTLINDSANSNGGIVLRGGSGSATVFGGAGTLDNRTGGVVSVQGDVELAVASVVNSGVIEARDTLSFTGDSVTNVAGAIQGASGSTLIFDTELYSGSVINRSGNVIYDGGLISHVLVDSTQQVRGDTTFVSLWSLGSLTIDNGVVATFLGSSTNHGTINGDITLTNGATLANFGTHNGLVNYLQTYESGGTVELMEITLGGSGGSGSDTMTVSSGTSVTSTRSATVGSQGILDIGAGSSLTAPLLTVAGAVVNNGTITGDVFIGEGGSLSGSGTILGTVTNEGTFNAGNSPGVAVLEDFINGATGVLEVEIGGTADGEFDVYEYTSSIVLDGTLKLLAWDGFVASHGDSFEFIRYVGTGIPSLTGTFALDDSLFRLGSGLEWHLDYSKNGSVFIEVRDASGPSDVITPEPGSLALLATGGLGLIGGWVRRRRGRAGGVAAA